MSCGSVLLTGYKDSREEFVVKVRVILGEAFKDFEA